MVHVNELKQSKLIKTYSVVRTSVGFASPVSSTVAVCPYLDISDTCPPRVSTLEAFTGRQFPSGATSNP